MKTEIYRRIADNFRVPTLSDRHCASPQMQSVRRNKRKIVLTTLEFRLLTYFMRHPNRIATLDMLAEQVWQQQHVSLNTLRVRIHALRRKINVEGEKPLIRAVKDMGYVLE